MKAFLQAVPSARFFLDALDILLVAGIVYAVVRFVRGTRAFNVTLGIFFAILIYWLSSLLELVTLNWLLFHFFGSALILLVVLFQNDIRRALGSLGYGSIFGLFRNTQEEQVLERVVQGVMSLANRKIGALIVIEKHTPLQDHVEGGILIDAVVSKELLTSLFLPTAPMHDGAALIQKGRISYVGCVLPLSLNADLDVQMGTRHRAAIGLAEETDAFVIVVSEEKAWVSAAFDQTFIEGLDHDALVKVVGDYFEAYTPAVLTPQAPVDPDLNQGLA